MDLLHQLFGLTKAGSGQATCPECATALQPGDLGELPLQRCPKCKGVWMTFDVFDKVPAMPGDEVDPYRDPADTAHTMTASRSPRGCPDCREPMINFLFRSKIWLDWCGDGHGMWLDRGELAMVHHIRTETEALSDAQKQELLARVGALKSH